MLPGIRRNCGVALVLALAALLLPGELGASEDPGSELVLRGAELERQGEWPAALELYRQAMALREQAFGPTDPRFARSLVPLAKLLRKLEDNFGATAGPMLERARDIDPPALDPTAEGLRMLLGFELSPAITLLTEALDEAEARFGPDTLEVAAILDILAEVGAFPWEPNFAPPSDVSPTECAERAIAIKRGLLGPDHPETIWSVQIAGLAYYAGGSLAEARASVESARSSWIRRFGHESLPAAFASKWLGQVEALAGDYARSLELLSEAAATTRALLGMENVNSLEAYMGTLQLAPEPMSGLAALADRLSDAADQLPAYPHVTQGHVLMTLGQNLRSYGDMARALRAFQGGLFQYEAAQGPNGMVVAWGCTQSAWLHVALGEYTTAVRLARRAVDIVEEILPDDDPFLGFMLNQMGEVLKYTPGHETERMNLYEQALPIWEQATGPESGWVGVVLANIGDVHEVRGELGEARRYYERSAALPPQDPTDPPAGDLGRLLRKQGEYARALPHLENAIAFSEAAFGQDPDGVQLVPLLIELARVQAATGDLSGAQKTAMRVERIRNKYRRLNARRLSEHQALRYAAGGREALDLALSLAVNIEHGRIRREAWDAMVRSRALVLDEMAMRRQLVAATTSADVRALYEEVAYASTRLANLAVGGGAHPEVLAQARAEKASAELELARKSATFARQSEAEHVGLKEIAAHLPEETALVAYVLYDRFAEASLAKVMRSLSGKPLPAPEPEYAAFILRRATETPVVVSLGPAASLEEAVHAARTRAAGGAAAEPNHERDYRSAGEELRRLVWDPVAAHLDGALRVFVVPDGAVNLVSFAALPSADDSYLIEDGPMLHYLSAERDLARFEVDSAHGDGLLVVGGAAYDETPLVAALGKAAATGPAVGPRNGDPPENSPVVRGAAAAEVVSPSNRRSSCSRFKTIHFEPLPGTDAEAERIAARWEDPGSVEEGSPSDRSAVTLLRGRAAGEASFKRDAPGKRVVHVATHGFFLGLDCELTGTDTRGIGGLASSKPEPSMPVSLAQLRDNPLLSSGLALAGANRRDDVQPDEEDGILTAEEVAMLDLTGVEWAVLSACGTGLGDVHAGEGVFGLRRAFQVAGAETLIMSLWSVDDEATQQWMTALYEGRLEEKLDTAEAVRQASLEVLQRRRDAGESTHPFYWAGFVAAGDWR